MLLVIKELLIKTIMRYHYTLIRMSKTGKLQENQILSGIQRKWITDNTAGEDVKWYTHTEKQFSNLLKN